MKKLSISLALILGLGWSSLVCAGSVTPAEQIKSYFSNIDGKSSSSLSKTLQSIISANYKKIEYGSLGPYYEQTDLDESGHIIDMYSKCGFTMSNAGSAQNKVCDCWNKEHSIPQSWFKEASPMKSDMYHVVPTDARVNNFRGNMPYGETSSTSYIDNNSKALGRIGSSNFSGYSGKVYEPDDEYKGDFARIYFYMVTRYLDKNFTQSGDASKVFTYSGGTAGLTTYAVNLFLKWHRQDPVSQKEIERNAAVYGIQRNRNPFVDYPFLAEYIWGKKAGEAVCLDCMMPSTDASFIPGKSDGWKGQSSGWEVIPTDEDNMTPTEGKIIRNGQLIIIANGVEYNAFGQRIK